MASTYPSAQWSTVKRFEVPCFAASDIVQGAVVRLASSGDWTVQMVQTSQEKPLGIARDYAAAGQPVSVFDYGNIQRPPIGAGASIIRQSYVGVVGTSSVVHPITGILCTYPVLGGVIGNGSPVGWGSTASATWAVGQAYESAALNDQFAFRVEPAILSGFVTSF
jgi:hypothetical protein